MSTQKQRDIETAREELADLVPGETVYTVLRHVSSSGMTRHIDVYVIRDDAPRYISWYVAKLTGYACNVGRYDGVKVGGCGMDMGFALIYSLSRALFPDGFDCIATDADGWHGRTCPSNDHVNYRETRGDVMPTHHNDGGYALKQRWI